MIKVAFYKGKGTWVDWSIRKWTRSIYSHTEILVDKNDGFIRLYSSSGRDSGVRCKIIPKDNFKVSHWDYIDVSNSLNEQSVMKFFVKRRKARYDYIGILLAQALPLKRHSINHYFCSEYCAENLGFSEPHTYSPQRLFESLN